MTPATPNKLLLLLLLLLRSYRFGVARLRLQTSLLHGVRALHASS